METKAIDVAGLAGLAARAGRRGAKGQGDRDALVVALAHRGRGEVGTSLDLLAHNLQLAALQLQRDEVEAARSVSEALRHLAALAAAAGR